MQNQDPAAAEMIGAIALTAIIVAAIGILGAQWIANIPTSSFPTAQLEIACGDDSVQGDFHCRSGVIGCADEEILPLSNCSYNCLNTTPSQKMVCDGTEDCSITATPQYQECVRRCESAPNCAKIHNNTLCNTIYICHNGGDALDINNLNISVNEGNPQENYWIYDYVSNTTVPKSKAEYFKASNVIKINSTYDPEKVMIVYQDYQSGQKNVMVSKRFR